jgi:hypothetical protein
MRLDLRVLSKAVTTLALSLLPSALLAQSQQKFSVQLSALSTGIVANGGVINGFGVEPQLRINGKYFSGIGILSIGIGGQYTSHTSSNDIGIKIAGAFVEPRLVIAKLTTDRINPYIAGRVAILNQSNDVASSSGGYAFGGGGGVALKLSENINLDLGVAGIFESFSESKTGAGRTFINGSMTSYAAKLGINIGFGN